MDVDKVLARATGRERLSREEGVHLAEQATLAELAAAANAVREERTDPGVVTYVVDRNINYTNVCNVYCMFCAFYRTEKDADAYVLGTDEILRKVEGLVAIGGTQVLLQGGLNPNLPLSHITGIFRAIRDRFPSVDIHSLTATEVEFWSLQHSRSSREVLQELKAAGMKSLPGGGMEILVDRVRKRVSPLKTKTEAYLQIHREAHELGMPSTATMMYGVGETWADRIEHLDRVRTLEDEAPGFTAFIPWSYQHDKSVPLRTPATTADEYLRVIALSRLYLDNIRHIQSGWVTEGHKVAQIALRFGADDWGGILMEENVISAAGTYYRMTPATARELIRKAGYVPAQRNTYYKTLRRFDDEPPPETLPANTEHGFSLLPLATNARFEGMS
ncbi:MAG: cyclic dehypoxanthinyl futalosine synthase [Methanobacteriota archaeon]